MVTSRLYFMHIYFPMLIGAIIYTFFRADKLFIFLLYEKLFFSEYLAVIRQYTMNWYMPDYIVYTLPDALWVYAFTIFLYTIWLFEKPSKWRAFFLSIPLIKAEEAERQAEEQRKAEEQQTSVFESYQNCTKLRAVHPDGVPEGHPAYASKHDRDKDGWACEN